MEFELFSVDFVVSEVSFALDFVSQVLALERLDIEESFRNDVPLGGSRSSELSRRLCEFLSCAA